MDATRWAFDHLGLQPTDSLDHINARLSTHTHGGVDFEHAKSIVLPSLGTIATLPTIDPYFRSPKENAHPFRTSFFSSRAARRARLQEKEGGLLRARMQDGNTRLPHAWTKVCSIKDFILQDVRKESEPQQWKWLTNPRDNATVSFVT